MESSGHSRLRHRMALLAVLPLALIGFSPATAAADEGPSPETSVNGSEQENSSGPGTPAQSGSGAGSTANVPVASGSSGPGATEPADDPVVEEPTPEQPAGESGSTAPGPGATLPQAEARQTAPVRAKPEPKVTICHRTNSRTNPYNQIAVAVSGIIGPSGHDTHTGPIFSPDVQDWGDIIPPIPPELPDGLNWPAGRAILDNGCEMKPDVGPLPSASIGDVVCDGNAPTVAVSVTNGADATAPAEFADLVDGVLDRVIGPVPPGQSRTVVVRGPLQAQENQTFTVEVRSPPAGAVIASRVLTAACGPGPPDIVEIEAQLLCNGVIAQGIVTATNLTADPVEVTATVDGTPVPDVLRVPPGESATGKADLSPFEDQTIDVSIFVNGTAFATYTVTPDCVAPMANPTVSVAGLGCPPPSATVTLGNAGDADSQVVFVILVDGKVVQETAPLFGGDTTTIVGDLSRFEDQTVVIELRANGEVLGSRTIHVNCTTVAGASGSTAQPASTTSGGLPGSNSGSGVLPTVGAGFGPSVLGLGLGLVGVGALLIFAGSRRRQA